MLEFKRQYAFLKVSLLVLIALQLFTSFYLIYYTANAYDGEEATALDEAQTSVQENAIKRTFMHYRLGFIALTVLTTVFVITGLVGVTFESIKMIATYSIFCGLHILFRLIRPLPGGYFTWVQVSTIGLDGSRIFLAALFLEAFKKVKYGKLNNIPVSS